MTRQNNAIILRLYTKITPGRQEMLVMLEKKIEKKLRMVDILATWVIDSTPELQYTARTHQAASRTLDL